MWVDVAGTRAFTINVEKGLEEGLEGHGRISVAYVTTTAHARGALLGKGNDRVCTIWVIVDWTAEPRSAPSQVFG